MADKQKRIQIMYPVNKKKNRQLAIVAPQYYLRRYDA